MAINVALGIEYQSLLRQLQLMQCKHNDDRQYECYEGAVKGHTEAHGDAGDIPLNSFVGLTQGVANTAHGADKANRGNRPRDVAHH